MKINTDTNIFGGMPDFDLIKLALRLYSKDNGKAELNKIVINENRFNFRTESARKKFIGSIQRSILVFPNQNYRNLIFSLYNTEKFVELQNKTIFWQLLINNDLFYLISKNVFIKYYLAGRTSIKASDVFAYLMDIKNDYKELLSWSEGTIKTVASKYLTILKKLNFVNGRQTKAFNYIRLTDEELVFFTYLIKSVEPNLSDILQSKYVDFFFKEKSDILQALKKVKFTDYFNMSTTGNNLNIELKYDYKELINVI